MVKHWQKGKYAYQENRVGSPELNLCPHGQIIFNKGYQDYSRRKGQYLNKQCWQIGYPNTYTNKFGPYAI